MAISPEEEMAYDPKLSATEVVEILRRHRPLPDKKYYDTNDEWLQLWYEVWQRQKPERTPLLDEFFYSWKMENKSHSLSDPWSNDYRYLRTKVLRWLLDPNRGRSLFWITEPFLVQEIPAAAQSLSSTIGEICRLGAVVSYSQRRVSARRFVLSIVGQLIRKYPLYRRVLFKELVDDPPILEKHPRTILKKLITEPWNTLATAHPFYLQNPPLIVVMLRQGWFGDEITELMELVAESSGLHRRSPLLWLVSGYPGDGHLMRALSKPNVWAAYQHETLSPDDAETKDDVSRLLRDGLWKIRSCRSDVFPEGEVWPTEEQFTCLTTNISGVYSFARTVLRFIGVEGGNPRQQLETCLASMAGSPIPSNTDPFGVHHYFLQRLLVNVAPDAISFLYIVKNHLRGQIREFAHLLGLSQSECYRSIESLSCFLAIDPLDRVGAAWELRVLDEGFQLFCEVGIQRRYEGFTSFSLAFASARLQIMQGLLNTMGCSSVSNLLETMVWGQSTPYADFTTICSLWGPQSHLFWSWPKEEEFHCLKSFDFHCLAGKVIPFNVLDIMVYHLHKLFPDCARTKPLTVVDEQFIEKCKTVAIPKNFMQHKREKDGVVEYALLGYGDQTVLVLWTWEVEHSDWTYTFRDCSVVIYSLDMLDEL